MDVQSQDVAPRPGPGSPTDRVVDVEQAEAALVEHYPRLVRLAYLVLPPALGRSRRVLAAHSLAQRALPRGRASAPVIPAQSAARDGDPGYAYVRLQVVRTALEAGLPLKRRAWPKRSQLPPLLPQVWGLRLFPRPGGADELALDQRLSALSGPARAVYVLRGLEKLPDGDVREVLTEAGVEHVDAALCEADTVPARYTLLDSPEFDPCSLQARPTDLMRRRRHTRAALAAAAALAVCGALVTLPGDGWGPDGAAAPVYAQNPAAEAALDPGRLVKASPAAWKTSGRTDFSVWPARGDLTGDSALLRRALAVWARPGETVRVSATPGTPTGGPSGPPQLLYAGDVDTGRVVILHDGLRIARYAEPRTGTAGAALDFARADGATGAEAAAVVLDRVDGNVRYLTAPWVTKAAERDLSKPGAGLMDLTLTDGITAPLASPATHTGACTTWNVLQLTDASGSSLLSDLGELLPAHLTAGRPTSPKEATGAEALSTWAPFACSLADVRGQGVRSVNTWGFARQLLPDASGSAAWVCTRAETWRGEGTRVLAQFHTPGGLFGAVTAKAGDVPACGRRDPHVLAGVLWKSQAGSWYLLAAGDRNTRFVRATGGVSGSAQGNLLAVPTTQGAQAGLEGTLEGGRSINGLR
ncbi:DNA-directed RNA polymerase specialized sigma24 family protein OS=Streptomyces aurantiogriseus OX=66870 GN=GCM10010251_54780 PE=4 SV=1 [Streptomyces aurantiogriseus]|uniref:DNA-directed RNA polymerase specialized sigma24 family protein n=1 Tax=Streptomyces aurantiogriseus TaxID=66870 RepID=A0A918CMN5_9ACTN|nr:hypothetical protein GCM10010251_54780 [Streptomyces aurantiogriseus]